MNPLPHGFGQKLKDLIKQGYTPKAAMKEAWKYYRARKKSHALRRSVNPRRKYSRLPVQRQTGKSKFRHQRLRSPTGLYHMRTVTAGKHRVVIGCPVQHKRGRCPVPTIAQAILHPRSEGKKRLRAGSRTNPSTWYDYHKGYQDGKAARAMKISEATPSELKDASNDYVRGYRHGYRGVKPIYPKYSNKNPIAIYNPKHTLIYGRALELRAEKTSGPYAGQSFKHPFQRASKVSVLGLHDGSVLLKSMSGKRLWGQQK